jgi:hypothetical protein
LAPLAPLPESTEVAQPGRAAAERAAPAEAARKRRRSREPLDETGMTVKPFARVEGRAG